MFCCLTTPGNVLTYLGFNYPFADRRYWRGRSVANEANPLPVGHKTGAPSRRTSTRGANRRSPGTMWMDSRGFLLNLSGEPNQVRVFGGASAYGRLLLGFRV